MPNLHNFYLQLSHSNLPIQRNSEDMLLHYYTFLAIPRNSIYQIFIHLLMYHEMQRSSYKLTKSLVNLQNDVTATTC